MFSQALPVLPGSKMTGFSCIFLSNSLKDVSVGPREKCFLHVTFGLEQNS